MYAPLAVSFSRSSDDSSLPPAEPSATIPIILNKEVHVESRYRYALMLGWFFHIASGVLVPMVLGLMISYVVMAGSCLGSGRNCLAA